MCTHSPTYAHTHLLSPPCTLAHSYPTQSHTTHAHVSSHTHLHSHPEAWKQDLHACPAPGREISARWGHRCLLAGATWCAYPGASSWHPSWTFPKPVSSATGLKVALQDGAWAAPSHDPWGSGQGGHGVATPVPGLVQVQCRHHHRGPRASDSTSLCLRRGGRWLSEPLPWGREGRKVVAIFVVTGAQGRPRFCREGWRPRSELRLARSR